MGPTAIYLSTRLLHQALNAAYTRHVEQ